MHVLVLAPSFPPESFGGAGRSTLELIEGLSELGHTFHVLTPARQDHITQTSHQVVIEGVSHAEELFSRPGFIERRRSFGARLQSLLTEQSFCLVHDSGGYLYGDVLADLRRWHDGPVLVQFRTCLPLLFSLGAQTSPNDHMRAAWALLQERKTVRAANLLICPTLELQQRFSALYGITAEIVPTGLRPRSPSPFAFGERERRILLAGRLEDPFKGAQFGLDVLARILSIEPRVRAVVTARAEHVHEMSGGQIDMARVIAFDKLPFAEFDEVLARSHLVFVPSIYDCFPRMVLEAMAFGRVPVASMTGAREIIAPGETGLTFDIFASNEMQDDLAAQMASLCVDDDRLSAMGRNARSRMLHAYAFDQMTASIDDAYRRLRARRTMA